VARDVNSLHAHVVVDLIGQIHHHRHSVLLLRPAPLQVTPSLSHTLLLSFSLTHTHSSLSLSHTHSSLSLSLSHTHLSHTHTHTPLALSLSHTHSSLSHTHTPHTHTHTHNPHTHTLAQVVMVYAATTGGPGVDFLLADRTATPPELVSPPYTLHLTPYTLHPTPYT